MHNGDYPGQAFFGVYRGRSQRVEATYNKLLENIQNYPGAIYEAFMNRAHAKQFSETGRIPEGATPIKPGTSRTTTTTTTSPVSRTMSTPALGMGKSTPPELKPKAVSMGAAVEKKPLGSLALGKTSESSKSAKPAATGSKPSGSGSGSGSGSSAKTSRLNITAALARGTLTPIGSDKSTSINNARNASTSAVSHSKGIEVWTDGSCLGNGKHGARAAYAVYFGPGDPRNEANRVPGPQTNNVGEIYAVIRALEIVNEGVKNLTIYTDSQYTIDCLKWLPGWIRRGGMNSSNKPAAHYGMVKYMDALIQRRGDRLNLVHVRGHQDNAGNNAADLMAREAAESPDVPPGRDWQLECVKLLKSPLVPVTGSPKITAVDSVPIKKEPDDGSDYGYSDIELDEATIDDIDTPLSRYPSDYSVNTRDTSPSDDKPAVGKKRSREEPIEEVPDSDVDRKAAKKVKEQGIKCPNCKHKFNVTLRK